jgi:hypothetical protein
LFFSHFTGRSHACDKNLSGLTTFPGDIQQHRAVQSTTMGRWHYPKWRRSLMQSVLGVIFLSSVGLAQWVVHDRTHNGVTRLGQLQTVGSVGIRPPEGWVIETKKVEPVLYVTQEPGTLLKKGRTLTVKVLRAKPDMAATDFLSVNAMADLATVPIEIGNFQGLLASMRRPLDLDLDSESDPTVNDNLVAGCVCHDGRGILIMLKCPKESPEESEPNVQLIRDIARKIQVQSLPTGSAKE